MFVTVVIDDVCTDRSFLNIVTVLCHKIRLYQKLPLFRFNGYEGIFNSTYFGGPDRSKP